MSMERDSYLDNIKILLLFMVAFAHNLIPFKDEGIGIESNLLFSYAVVCLRDRIFGP